MGSVWASPKKPERGHHPFCGRENLGFQQKQAPPESGPLGTGSPPNLLPRSKAKSPLGEKLTWSPLVARAGQAPPHTAAHVHHFLHSLRHSCCHPTTEENDRLRKAKPPAQDTQQAPDRTHTGDQGAPA